MKVNRKGFWIFLLFTALLIDAQHGYAQQIRKIKLVQADALEGGYYQGKAVRKLLGNVIFKQDQTRMICDSAYQYVDKNGIEAFSNIRITKGDSITLTGDRLSYNGDTKKANMRNNVVMTKGKTKLYTDILNFDMQKDIARYFEGGRIEDGDNRLTSIKGTFYDRRNLFVFSDSVKLKNPEYTIITDTLHYNKQSGIAYFQAPTKMIGEDGTLWANAGSYNTKTKDADFRGRSRVDYQEYILTADTLHYNDKVENGSARGNVVLYSTNDSVIVEGQQAKYWGKQGKTKVYDKTLMKSINDQDTLYLTADTLISVYDSTAGNKKIHAFHDAEIFRHDVQGIADSLVYDMTDSTIQFFQDPVLWHEHNQLMADSVFVSMQNRKIRQARLFGYAFIASVDTMNHFNQVSGDSIFAFFHDNNINKVKVRSNAQSIYHALEEDTLKLIGMNRAHCRNIDVKFDSGRINTITFIDKPRAKFIPPHEINASNNRLEGFRWRISEKPSRSQLIKGKQNAGMLRRKRPGLKQNNQHNDTVPASVK